MDFTKYHLTYNAAAHFAAKEKYPDGLMQAMVEDGAEGFDALCWALEELSTQGELIRRNLGYDPKEPLQAKILKAILRPADLLSAKTEVLAAINKGLSPSQEEEAEIDEVLAELQKKNGKELTAAQYLGIASALGISVKDAMLMEIGTLFQISEMRWKKKK